MKNIHLFLSGAKFEQFNIVKTNSLTLEQSYQSAKKSLYVLKSDDEIRIKLSELIGKSLKN